jgi:hypothetical protein
MPWSGLNGSIYTVSLPELMCSYDSTGATGSKCNPILLSFATPYFFFSLY